MRARTKIWFRDAMFQNMVRRKLDRAMSVTATSVKKNMKSLIMEPYPPASAPGMPPHRRTGTLRRSITKERIKRFHWLIGATYDVPYARDLEVGRAKPPLAPRPFMGMALAMARFELHGDTG